MRFSGSDCLFSVEASQVTVKAAKTKHILMMNEGYYWLLASVVAFEFELHVSVHSFPSCFSTSRSFERSMC